MAGTCLSLTSATEVAAGSDGQSDQHHDEDGGEASGKTGPMEVDEADPVVRLVEGHVIGLVSDLGLDGDGGVVLGVNCWRSTGGCIYILLKPLVDETLLVVFVNNGFHDEDGTQVEAEPERSATADGAIPCRRDERRSGTES